MDFRTGQIVELHTPAHPYMDSRAGIVDPGHIIPATTERFRVARVTRRPGDVRLALRRDDNTGCAIVVGDWLKHFERVGCERTIKVVG